MSGVSVIVPVYNVEQYLERCVDSILAQTYADIELVLVDDGSTDQSPSICDEYARIDERVVVVHQNNGGLSAARNTGLRKACGKYILFVDSDDYILPDACRSLMKIAEESGSDIVTGEARKFECGASTHMSNYDLGSGCCSGPEYLKLQLEHGVYRASACINLYRREFLLNHCLFFYPGIFHEDEEWTPRVFIKARSVRSAGIVFYHYMIRPNSITRMDSKIKHGEDLMCICKKLISYGEEATDIELKRLLFDHALVLYFQGIVYRYENIKKNQSAIDRKFPMRYAFGKKIKFWAGLVALDPRLFYRIWKGRQWIQLKMGI